MQVTLRQFVKELRVMIQKNTTEKSLQLGKGQTPNMEAYNRVVGWISGMDAAGDLADKMLRQLEETDRETGDLPEMPQAGVGQ